MRGAALGLLAAACSLGDLVESPGDQVQLSCLVTDLQADATLSGELNDQSCRAPFASGRFANLYRVPAGEPDSLSIMVVASEFAPRLLVVDSADFQRRPAIDTGQCPRLPGAACVRHYPAARGAATGILVSSQLDGAVGSYVLVVTGPRPPRAPTDLEQFGPDATTPVPAGGEMGTTTVVLSAAVSDPDTLEHWRLEVEVRPVSQPFEDRATASSSPAAARVATVRIDDLQNGTAYRWQARTVDETGRATAWIPFGGNQEHLADFRTAASVARLAFRIQPRTTRAGEGISPAMEVVALDASGNVVTGFSGSVTLGLAAGGGSGASITGGNPSVQAKDGVAVFGGVAIERAGSGYRFEAVATGGAAATSDPFDVVPGPATRLLFTVQPSTTTANRVISPPVRVTALDAFGNVATGFRGTVTIAISKDPSLGLARLSGDRDVNAVDGVASFVDLSIDTPGNSYTLTASSQLGFLESAAFNITVF